MSRSHLVREASIEDALARAIERRAPWLSTLHDTDCVRLLVGAVEDAPGITIDRYGPILLIQTGEAPLEPGDPEKIAARVERSLGLSLTPVWNHRPAFRREGFAHWHRAGALHDAIGLEEGLRFAVDPRALGLDPPLFLDLRAGRRKIRAIAAGRSILNVFAYTCGIGVAAAAGGARSVINVDFARSALDVGAKNAALNAIELERFELWHEDAIPILRQLAGSPVKGRAARRSFMRVGARTFDVVALDPPRWAKTPFGAIDVVRDYPSLLKPAMLAIARGGALFATSHVPSMDRASFESIVRRTAQKIDRAIATIEWIEPDPDVPRSNGDPPLKMLLARLD